MKVRGFGVGIAALAVTLVAAPSASAEVIVGVDQTAPHELVAFDSSAPGTFVSRPRSSPASSAPVAVTGLGAGETIVGIDYRPANGDLYAVTKDASNVGRLYTINEGNGTASLVAAGVTFALGAGTAYGIDFNPVVDRLRIVSNIAQPGDPNNAPVQVGNNMRVHPDTGALVTLDTSFDYPSGTNDGVNPGVVAGGYTNNFAGANDTTVHVYDRQGAAHSFARLGGVGGTPSPNTGELTRPGGTSFVAFDPDFGLDVSAAGRGFISASGGANSLFFSLQDPSSGNAGGGAIIGPGGTRYPHISAVPAGVLSVRDVTVDEGAGTATVTIDRERGSLGTVQADLSTVNGTAIAGADYSNTLGVAMFAHGEDEETFTVPITQDPADEPDETFAVNVFNPTGGAVIADGTGAVTINDDDPTPSPLAIGDEVVTEGEGATVTVSRTGGGQEAVTVDYATADGSAGADDFSAKNGTLAIPAGQNSASFTVQTTQDSADEADESFSITLSNPTGPATLADPSGTVRITDDDAPPADIDPPTDIDPPGIGLDAKDPQAVGGAIEVRVTCDEACNALGQGELAVRKGRAAGRGQRATRRFELLADEIDVEAGATGTLVLGIPKKVAKVASKALRRGGTDKAIVRVEASDTAGNSSFATLKVELELPGGR